MKLTLKHALAAIVLVLSLVSSAVEAWECCSQPSAPFCATGYGPFDETYDFDRNPPNYCELGLTGDDGRLPGLLAALVDDVNVND